MSDPIFQGGLASAKAISGSIAVSAIDDRGMIDLRGDFDDKKFVTACKKSLGLTLPSQPRQSTSKNDITALWLSPDQWLITCRRASAIELTDKLQKALSGIHSLAVNVSDARSIIRLEGEGARLVMMKGSPVDFTAPEFSSGFVRRVRFAELAGLVHVVADEPETIDLYVFRSYAIYAWNWISATSSRQSKLTLFGDQPMANL